MRKLILLILAVPLFTNVWAQSDRYWVNGAGNWNDTQQWSETSGGAPGASIPVEFDNVIFDENSFAKTDESVNIDADAKAANITVSGVEFAVKGKKNLEIFGSVNVLGVSFNKYKGDIIFSGDKSNTIAIGTLNSNIYFNSKKADWTLQSDLITSANIYLVAGSFNTNGFGVEANEFSVSGTQERMLTLGATTPVVSNWVTTDLYNFTFGGGVLPFKYNPFAKATKDASSFEDPKIVKTNASCPDNADSGANDDWKVYVICDTVYRNANHPGKKFNIYLTDAATFPTIFYATITGVDSTYNVTDADVSLPLPIPGTYKIYVEISGTSESGFIPFSIGPSSFNTMGILVNKHINCPPDVTGLSLRVNEGTIGGAAPYTFAWSGGSNSNPTPATLNQGIYEVTVTDSKGCVFSGITEPFVFYPAAHPQNTYTYAIGRPAPLNITSGEVVPDNSCQGMSNGSLTLGTYSGGTGPSFTFAAVTTGSPAPGAGLYGASPIGSLSAGVYDLYIKDNNGCTAKDDVTHTIAETPAVSVNPIPDDEICGTGPYQFSGVTASNYSSISWQAADFRGIFNPTTGNLNPEFTPHPLHILAQTIDLTLTLGGNGNCPSVLETMTLDIFPSPTVSPLPAPPGNEVCAGVNLPIDGNPTVHASTSVKSHLWAGDTGPIAGQETLETPTFNTASTGTYNLTYTVTDNNDCQATGNLQVIVNDVPATPGAITGETEPCRLVATTYSITAVSGADDYTWTAPTGWTGTSTTNSITLTPTATAVAGNITVTANNSCGSSAASSLAVTIDEVPSAAGAITGNAAPCRLSATTYSITAVANADDYTWTAPAGWTGTSTTNSITLTPTVTAVAGNVTVTPKSTCGSGTSSSLAVIISEVPSAAGAITGDADPCRLSATTYSITAVSGATAYTWTAPTGWTGTSTTNSITLTPTATAIAGNVTVTPNNSCGSGTSSSLAVTIDEIPSAAGAITGNNQPCRLVATTYSITAVSGATAYTWTAPAGWTGTSTTNSITLTPTATAVAGNINVTPDNACGSGTSSSLAVTIDEVPSAAGAITGNAAPCRLNATTYSITAVANADNYTWTAPAGWTGTSTTNSITLTPTATAVAGNVTVTPNSTCGSGTSSSLAVTISEVPSAAGAITGDAGPCRLSATTYSITAVSGATDYTWTAPTGWTGTSTTNSITLTPTATAVAGNVTVTPNNACGSGTSSSLAVTIDEVPSAAGAITGNNQPCRLSATTYSITAVANADNYTWTAPAGWTGTSTTNSITLTPTATAVAGNITVTPNNACGSGTSSSLAVTIDEVPSAAGAITGNAAPCRLSATTYSITAVANADNYTWTAPAGWTGTSTTNSITLTPTATAVAGNVTVTPKSTCGSGTSSSLAVIISEVPSAAGAITGDADPCRLSATTYSITAVSGATAYTWTAPTGWTGTSTTNSITLTPTATAVAGNVTVTPNNACGSGTSSSLAVTIDEIPSAAGAITGNNQPCRLSATTYSITAVSGATAYTWTAPTGWTGTSTTNSITLTPTATAVAGNITVTPNNACGSGTSSSLAVTIDEVPSAAGAITGNVAPCRLNATTYSITAVANADNYTWTAPAGWTGTSTTNSITLTPTATAVAGNITVTPNSTCGSGTSSSLAVTISEVPSAAGAITGDAGPCRLSATTYSITAVSGATAYTWTAPTGWTGTSTTNSITLTPTATAVAGNVTVTPNNACGSGTSSSLAVTIDEVPSAAGAITGNNQPCRLSATTYSITAVANADNYTWTAPAGWTGTSTTNSITLTPTATAVAGNITVTPNSTCGSGTSSSLAVTIDEIPSAAGSITGNNQPCRLVATTYSITAVANADNYTWTAPAGWTGTSTTNSITLTPTATAVVGNITVTPNSTCGSGTSSSLAVTIDEMPSAAGAITGNNQPCRLVATTYSITAVANADNYTWSAPAGWTGASTTNSITLTPTATAVAGNITVTPNSTCGSGTSSSLAVTIDEIPSAAGAITGDASPCRLSATTYTITAVANADTYTWTAPAGWTGTSTTNSITLTPTATAVAGNITVTPNSTCGSGVSSSLAVTVDEIPSAAGAITGNNQPCRLVATTYSITAVAGADSYIWAAPAGWTGTSTTNSITLTPTATAVAGNITVTPNNACGSGTSSSLAVTIDEVPSAAGAITGNNQPCRLVATTYSITAVANADNYTWTAPAGWTGTSTTNSITLTPTATAVSGNITVTPNSTCGSGTSSSLAVTIDEVPSAAGVISGDDSPCRLSTVTYSITAVTNADNYTWVVPAGWTGTSTTTSITLTATATAVAGNITVTPNSTCGSGASSMLAVTIDELPTPPTSVTATLTNMCEGSLTRLQYIGGSGDTFEWYSDATATTYVGAGYDFGVVPPVGTTTYYGRWETSTGCGVSSMESVSVSVTALPVAATGIVATDSNLCAGESTTLSVPDGSGDEFVWYTGSCGGTEIGRGISLPVTPAVTTTYYGRWETASCGSSACSQLAIVVNSLPSPSVTASLPFGRVCVGSDITLDGNPDGATQYSWTGTGLQSPTNQEDVVFNHSVAGNYTITYTVTNANGCIGNTTYQVKNLQAPTANAGNDTVVCYGTLNYDFSLANILADTTYASLLTWTNATTGVHTGFSSQNALHPLYTIQPADVTSGMVNIVLASTNGVCTVTDTMVLSIPTRLQNAVGGDTPFLINKNSTIITVNINAQEATPSRLVLSLISPSADTVLLHNCTQDFAPANPAGCSTFEVFNADFDNLTFTSDPTFAGTNIDLCDFSTAPAYTPAHITGTFDADESWDKFHGLNPSEGGWRLLIEVTSGAAVGTRNLEGVTLTFGDTVNGVYRKVKYEDLAINEVIPQKKGGSADYFVPIGLWTRCAGCGTTNEDKAMAIVNATGGTQPYKLDETRWVRQADALTIIGDTAYLCEGIWDVFTEDALGCITSSTVTVNAPKPIKIKSDSTGNIVCYGDSTGYIALTASEGAGAPYTYMVTKNGEPTFSMSGSGNKILIDSLNAGTYNIFIDDVNSCTKDTTITISQPAALFTYTSVVVPTTCNNSIGTITLTPAGGWGNYKYLWDIDNSTANKLINLSVAEYSFQITDDKGCIIRDTLTMIDNGDVAINNFVMVNNVTCRNGCDGTVAVQYSGSGASFSFAWDNGIPSVTDTAYNVCGGTTYTVTVTDNLSCSAVESFTVPNPDTLMLSAEFVPTSGCNAAGTASVTANVTGGKGSYVYQWTDALGAVVSNTVQATDQPVGKYYITVTDNNGLGCSVTDSIVITVPNPLVISNIVKGATNCNDSVGIATATVIGGVEPYAYQWYQTSSGLSANIAYADSSTADLLWVDVFTVVVTDNNGCVDSTNVIIDDIGTVTFDTDVLVDPTCGANGSAEVSNFNDGAPFVPTSIEWSNGENTAIATALAPGLVSVIVSNGTCSTADTITISGNGLLEVDTIYSFADFTSISDPGGNGYAIADVDGGQTPYTYTWTDEFGTDITVDPASASLYNLEPGWYYLSVEDLNTCVANDSVQILNDVVGITITDTTHILCYGDSTGSITAMGTGGPARNDPAKYTYQWANSGWSSYPLADSTGATISNLAAGTYNLTVTSSDLGIDQTTTKTIEIRTLHSDYTALFTEKPASCTAADGELYVDHTSETGGMAPYTYEWYDNTGAFLVADDTVTGIAAGSYTVQVTDANSCIYTVDTILSDNGDVLVSTKEINDVTCVGGSDGSLSVSVTGGEVSETNPYVFVWEDESGNPSGNDSTITGLATGIYYLTVTDTVGCQETYNVLVGQADTIKANIAVTSSLECGIATSVSLTSNTTGGTGGTYTYVWTNVSGDTVSTTRDMADQPIGKYYVEIKDGASCTIVDSITVVLPAAVDITNIATVPTNCADSVGTATATVVGGVQPYTFSWTKTSNSSPDYITNANSATAEDLWVDVFTLLVTDRDGCTDTETVILDDIGTITFDTEKISDPTCGENGSARVYNFDDGSGSFVPTSILWSSTETNDTSIQLAVGINTVIVSSASCQKADTITLVGDILRVDNIYSYADFTSTTDPGGNGYAVANIDGGQTPYTYTWSDISGTDLTKDPASTAIYNLEAGWYYLQVEDAASCIINDSVFINNDTLNYVITDTSHIICYGGNDGSVTALGTGGPARNDPSKYTYQWSYREWDKYPLPDSTGATITNLKEGTYYVTVTSSDLGFTQEVKGSVVLRTENDAYATNFYNLPSSCTVADGELAVNKASETGGVAPYIYRWLNDDNTFITADDTVKNIAAGAYKLVVSYGGICSDTLAALLDDIGDSEIAANFLSEPQCYGSTGIIELEISDSDVSNGDESPYNYSLISLNTGDTITKGIGNDYTYLNAVAGDYRFKVTDKNGCIEIMDTTLSQPDQIDFDVLFEVPDCPSSPDGMITITNITGGKGAPYEIEMEDSILHYSVNSDSVYYNLFAKQKGNFYEVWVRDANNLCGRKRDVSLESKVPTLVVNSIDILNHPSCLNSVNQDLTHDGILEVHIDGVNVFDSIEYKYFGAVEWTQDSVYTDLRAGSQYVEFKTYTIGLDTLTCIESKSIYVPAKTNIDPNLVLRDSIYDKYYCPADTVRLVIDPEITDSTNNPFSPEPAYTSVWYGGVTRNYLGKELYQNVDSIGELADTTSVYSVIVTANQCYGYSEDTVRRYIYQPLNIVNKSPVRAAGSEIELVMNEDGEFDVDIDINGKIIIYDTDSARVDYSHSYNWFSSDINIGWVDNRDTLISYPKPLESGTYITGVDTFKVYYAYSGLTQLCYLIDSVSIDVLSDIDPVKAYSPNGDGINDTWEIVGLEGYKGIDLMIYNRWGGLIWKYQGDLYGGPDDTNEWDGKNTKGKDAPSGSYFYQLKYKRPDGSEAKTKGYVTILR